VTDRHGDDVDVRRIAVVLCLRGRGHVVNSFPPADCTSGIRDKPFKTISVPIEVDEDGYLGRECPVKECLGYFKITPGTGIKGPAPCVCPYCGHSGDNETFWTQEQIEYAKSVAFRKISDAVFKDLKTLEFSPPRGGLIGIRLTVNRTSSHPIRYYREKQLETEVVCDGCTLRYAIYGVFGWCSDCGAHNSRQILDKTMPRRASSRTKCFTTGGARALLDQRPRVALLQRIGASSTARACD
jgi:hypothetical protein